MGGGGEDFAEINFVDSFFCTLRINIGKVSNCRKP